MEDNIEDNIIINAFEEEYIFKKNDNNKIDRHIYNIYLELLNKYNNNMNVNEHIEYCNKICCELVKYMNMKNYSKDYITSQFLYKGDHNKCIYFSYILTYNDIIIILYISLIYKICKNILDNGICIEDTLNIVQIYMRQLKYSSSYVKLCWIHLTLLNFINIDNIEKSKRIDELQKCISDQSYNSFSTQLMQTNYHIYIQLYIDFINKYIRKLGGLTQNVSSFIYRHNKYGYIFYNRLKMSEILKIIENTIINRYYIDKIVLEELLQMDCEIILLLNKYFLLTSEYYIYECKTLLSFRRHNRNFQQFEKDDNCIAISIIPRIIMLLEWKYYPINIYDHLDIRLLKYCNKLQLIKFVNMLFLIGHNIPDVIIRFLYDILNNFQLYTEIDELLYKYIIKNINVLATCDIIQIIRQNKIELNRDIIMKLMEKQTNFILIKFLIEKMNVELTVGDIITACYNGDKRTLHYFFNKCKDDKTVIIKQLT